MKDRSKKLTVINTGEKRTAENTHVAERNVSTIYRGVHPDLSAYLLKSIWESVFEIKRTEDGVDYIFIKLPVATQQGITMYADGTNLDLPSIYAGLPIDGETLYWDGEVLKSKGGGEGTIKNFSVSGEGNALTDVTLNAEGTGLVFTKGLTFVDKKYLEDDYYTKTNLDELFFKKDDASGLFVTLDGKEQDILGVKTFVNGLKIGTSKVFQSQDDVVYIDANLVVRGGITMYGVDNVDVPTLMQSLNLDPETLEIDESGRLTVIGGGGGSIEYPLSWSGFSSGSWDGTSEKNIYIPSKTSELTNDASFVKLTDMNTALAKYLPITGGTITGDLRLKDDTNYGRTIYFGDGSYAYITEDSDDHLNIYASNGVSINGYKALTAGNYTDYFNADNYITSLGNEYNSDGTYLRYLTITKGDTTSTFTVGYATNTSNMIASYISDLNSTSAWNSARGIRCSLMSKGATGLPGTPDNDANGCLSFYTSYSKYGVQIAYINKLSAGYEYVPHLYCRNYYNGTYYDWLRITTNGPQMEFENLNCYSPYIRIRYMSQSWYYLRMYSDGMWMGISNTNGMRIDSSGNLLSTGSMTFKSTSDKRLKRNIRSFNACEVLMSLGGVYKFEYTDNEVKRNVAYKGTHIGLIYQNVKGTELERMCLEREDGYGSLNYIDTSFISLLAGVGMEHETRIQKLELENRELRMEVERLKRL